MYIGKDTLTWAYVLMWVGIVVLAAAVIAALGLFGYIMYLGTVEFYRG